jgi:hypothetical protein
MNKIIIRSILFIIVAAVVIFFYRYRSPFGEKNSSFISEPRTEITKIEFSDEGRKLSLEMEDDKWLLNGKLETRKSSILFIVRILTEIKIKSPVSDDLFDSVITRNGILPVKVKVYERRRLLNTFLVYKTSSNIYGNIMKKSARAKPFIVYVPGFEGDIGSGFTLNELYWQPYTVFSLLPSEISSVNFENFSEPASSFTIVREDHHYVLLNEDSDLTAWDSAMVKRYLSYFTMIPFESWAFETGEKEKKMIEAAQPLYRITVTTTDGKETILTLWERMTGDTNQKDSDRLLGKTQLSDELFIMRYFDIDPLIKKRSYFFPE